MVNRVVPAGQLRTEAQAMAAGIAANAPLSVRAAKQLVSLSPAASSAARQPCSAESYEPVHLSEDAHEGPRSFQEKRSPRWQGR